MPRVAQPPPGRGPPRAPPMRPRVSRPRAPAAKPLVRPKTNNPNRLPPPKREPSLEEQLQARLGGLKAVDQSQIQKDKQQHTKSLTGQQEMKLTA